MLRLQVTYYHQTKNKLNNIILKVQAIKSWVNVTKHHMSDRIYLKALPPGLKFKVKMIERLAKK